MLVELTYACKMGCSHCMSDCTPDGEHMSLQVLEDTLKFMVKHQILTWNFSGGELFEHPQILEILKIIEDYWVESKIKCPLTFATNGRELVRNKEIYHTIENLQKKHGKRSIILQVTDDSRYYPDPLSPKEKYWLSKLNAIIDTVPSDPSDKSRILYPQGRALVNYPDSNWNTIAPKCSNCILIAKQMFSGNFSDLVNTLSMHGRFCTPVIAPNGDIKVGESALCPSIASIYDTDDKIMKKIRETKCHQCKIAWKRLKENNPMAYQMLNS